MKPCVKESGLRKLPKVMRKSNAEIRGKNMRGLDTVDMYRTIEAFVTGGEGMSGSLEAANKFR